MDSPLDRVLPQFAHREVHTLVVSASPELVWAALREPVLERFVARGYGVVLDEEPRALAVAAPAGPSSRATPGGSRCRSATPRSRSSSGPASS